MPSSPDNSSLTPASRAAPARGLCLRGEKLECQREGSALFQPVSFELNAGESLLLAGPNGIGKTTLLEAIAGLRHYSQGQLHFNHSDLREHPLPWRQSLCYIGHKDGNKKALTCQENLDLTSRLYGHRASRQDLLDALEAVGLAGYEHHLAGNLSAGQKKRLSLARLPLVQAPVWILDEPFVNLDVTGCQWLMGWIKAHLRDGGLLLVTAHDNRDMQAQATHRIELRSPWDHPEEYPPQRHEPFTQPVASETGVNGS